MNCFHFVSLKYWTQYLPEVFILKISCELLSFCIFEILNTVNSVQFWNKSVLWIAFILYLWNIEHSLQNQDYHLLPVVNCFHFVSLKYWTQYISMALESRNGCELLSFCIFEILNTVVSRGFVFEIRLWIAFILYLWNIEHSLIIRFIYMYAVVNCFHFVSLKYWTQCMGVSWLQSICCELLSFCIFEILNTVSILP